MSHSLRAAPREACESYLLQLQREGRLRLVTIGQHGQASGDFESAWGGRGSVSGCLVEDAMKAASAGATMIDCRDEPFANCAKRVIKGPMPAVLDAPEDDRLERHLEDGGACSLAYVSIPLFCEIARLSGATIVNPPPTTRETMLLAEKVLERLSR